MKKIFSFFLAIIIVISFPVVGNAAENRGFVFPEAAFCIREKSSAKLMQKSTTKTVDNGTFTFKVTGNEYYDYANTVLTELNKIRTDVGLPKLKMDKTLLEVAMQRAAECAVFYSHTRPDNSDCFSLAADDIYCLGENIAIGYETPKAVIKAWKNSQGHYENMTGEYFNCVGIGCFKTSNGKLCWVQYFGETDPEVIKKTGTVKATHKITAAAENLSLTVSVSEKVSFDSTANTTFDFIVQNYNITYPFALQKIPASYFYYSSSNSKVIAVKDKTEGVLKGEGKTKITAKVKKNSKIKCTSDVYIDHIHTGKLKSTSEKISGCKKTVTKKYVCKKCAEAYTKKTTTYHFPGKWKTVKKATVYRAGEKQRKCTKCDKVVETATIPQLKCSVPTLSEISNAQNGVEIKWNKVKGADRYRIYRKTKTSDWEYIKTTSKTSYIDTTATSGTKYYYAVKSRNEAGNTSLSKSLSKFFISAPVLESPEVIENNISLLWNQVDVAQGYVIYRKTVADEDFIELATVTEPYYTDLNLEIGTEYTYKVKAYYSKTSSACSDEVALSINY